MRSPCSWIVVLFFGKQVHAIKLDGRCLRAKCDADPGRVESALEQMMIDVEGREALQARLLEITSKLGEPGAHVRAAAAITQLLK